MALKLAQSLVLLGIPAVRGVVTGVERVDAKQGREQKPAYLSHPRHLAMGRMCPFSLSPNGAKALVTARDWRIDGTSTARTHRPSA